MTNITEEAQAIGMIMKLEDTGEICAIKGTNRKVLIENINSFVNSDWFKGQDGASYLHVELSGEQLGCLGCSAEYKTEADVPEHSVPCTCGNPKHWLIKYDEELG